MTYPLDHWRLLITSPASGAWNMAVDEAILQAVQQKIVPPTLRLYAWHPPCLSLGYAQPASDIDLHRLQDAGWDWVRRPTGGRAILHTDELTYSVIAPLSNPRVSGGVLESYQHLSTALLAALHILNIPAESQCVPSSSNLTANGAVCFEVPSNYEIVAAGKKLLGSAQARRKNVLLQHGTLPLFGDLTRITHVLASRSAQQRQEAARRLLDHATTVEMVLGKKVTWQQAAQAFILGFSKELNIEFDQSTLTGVEINQLDKLVQTKYAHSSWLERL